MAVPVTDIQLSKALGNLMGMAADVKTQTVSIRAEAVADDVPRSRFVEFMTRLNRAVVLIDAMAVVPGMLQYAKDQYDNQTLDIVTDFGLFRTECIGLRNWIFNNFPKDAVSGAWLVSVFANDGVETQLVMAPAELTVFVTECDALLATTA